MSIQHYYSTFRNLWAEYDSIKYASVPANVLAAIQEIRAFSQRYQFLTKLHPEYETLISALISRRPLPSLDFCLNELLHEERLVTKANLVELKPDNYATAYPARGTP